MNCCFVGNVVRLLSCMNVRLSCVFYSKLTYFTYLQLLLLGGSVAEWLACLTQAQKGPGSNRSRDAVG